MTRINSPRIFVGDIGETSAYIMDIRQEARSGEAATGTKKVKPGEDSND